MVEKISLKYPVVVEGKYDKSKVSIVVSSPIIALDGFSVFSNQEKKLLLKRMANETGIILLTDSDRSGQFIRSKLKGILKGKIYNVYAPSVLGKERRKQKPSADGLLGVEGIDADIIRELLLPFVSDSVCKNNNIDKARFYEDGFSGRPDSSRRRERLSELLSLPKTLTANALLEAINLLVTEQEYISALERINNE